MGETSEVVPVRVAFITLDNHLAGAMARAGAALRRDWPGLDLSLHAATEFAARPQALERARSAIASADIVIVALLFLEEHIALIRPALEARREACDAMVCLMSAASVNRLTRMGALRMDAPESPVMAFLKRLRGKGRPEAAGAAQMAMLRRLPKLLRFVPGKAQDVRAYFLAMLAFVSATPDNLVGMVRALVARYGQGPRAALRAGVRERAPDAPPDLGLYHPGLPGRMTETAAALPRPAGPRGTVGLLLMRSPVLAGDTAHYDAVIAALEARGLAVLPAFASGLDQRPAIDAFFRDADGRPRVDTVVSLAGFSLVGGPAYNDADAAVRALESLDVPAIAAHALEFETLEAWGRSGQGLSPIESTMMVAIPELDGTTVPSVFAGRSDGAGQACAGCPRGCVFAPNGEAVPMHPCPERVERLADRVDRLVALRAKPPERRRVAVVLYNFPPNAGATGSAAYLAVYESLWNTLTAMAARGYRIALPEGGPEGLRRHLLGGNAADFGTEANVAVRVAADDHVRREPFLAQIEAQWGAAPGRVQADARSLFVLGQRMGDVFVGFQPPIGVEGDPMRLLFERDCTPNHAFSAFYRFIREDFAADAVLHFGMHGALEFMPGKQVGLSGACWPERLIGDLPNVYLYAANNPSEGAIARRRSGATLVSHLTPPVVQAGLYRGLADLRASIDRWRVLAPDAAAERAGLAPLIHAQAAALDLVPAEPEWGAADGSQVDALVLRLREIETALIPDGLHVVGGAMAPERLHGLLQAVCAARGMEPAGVALEAVMAGRPDAAALSGLPAGEDRDALVADLHHVVRSVSVDHEIPALLRALDGRYVPPVPGGDLMRGTVILPTGRNITGFDPFRIPSAHARRQGAAHADLLLARHAALGHDTPRIAAVVLWGTDNLKTEGVPISIALALLGAEPRFDEYGRLAGARLLPLEALGRARVDVLATPSGIFRDLLPLHMKMLAEAAWLAARADEPEALNPVRANARWLRESFGLDENTAALRVFSHDNGAYGVNVNQLIDAGTWDEVDDLADQYETRTSFAHDRHGAIVRARDVMRALMQRVDLSYQSLDSVELGITTIDHYVDMLGAVATAVERVRGSAAPVYVGDATQGAARVRTIAEQVAFETRTRTLNPRWFEGQLRHGYEGVRQIEAQVTNTLGWSATTAAVAPWVYDGIARTFVLDEAMRRRLAELNPKASLRLANRLLEAERRRFWAPDADMLDALRRAADDIEDTLEDVPQPVRQT
jgi:magnesium chelatase subunit H